MDSYGFYIRYFEARGASVKTINLKFEKGCNVVLGKSDIGKTTLYTIIEFVLGKSSNELVLPPEGRGYTSFLLEIHTYDESIYTLRRKINASNVQVCKCTLSMVDSCSPTEYSCSSKSTNSFSDFILRISNIPEIYCKSSDTKSPTKVSISMLRHLFMIDESRVSAKDKSPLLYFSNPSQQWVEKNLVAFLMTGLDDCEFRPNEDPMEKKSRIKGKIEYLEQSLAESNEKLKTLGDVSYISLTDDAFIKSYKNKLAEVTKQEQQFRVRINNCNNEIIQLQNSKKDLLHLIKRLEELKEDYNKEISKIQFINTASQLVSNLQDVVCPLCGSPIEEHMLDSIESSSYTEAIKNEYKSLHYKVNDLVALISEKQNELNDIEKSLRQKKSVLDSFYQTVNALEPDINELKDVLSKAESNLKSQFLQSVLKTDIKDKEEIINRLKKDLSMVANNKNGQREEICDDFKTLVKSNLVAWNFIDSETSISFDYKKYDIKIGERHRSSYGKGNRSITFTAVILALFDYCCNTDRPFSRLLVIDSPLCTKYGDKPMEEDILKLGTIDAFANYCNTKEWNYQVIVIDNKFTETTSISDLGNINVIDLEAMGGLFIQ